MVRYLILVALVFVNVPAHVQAEEGAQERAQAMIKAELAFQPSVFNGEKFPSCDFLRPGQMRQWIGDYTFDVTFYSKDYEVVEKPTATGRYGAVVKITAEDGRHYTRYRTLFRTPERMWLSFKQLDGELVFPAATGVDERIWHNQRQSVNNYVGSAIGRDIQRSHDFAVLLAGMDDIGPQQGPVSQLQSAVTKDRQWWLKLKRKLNGNAERFTEAIVTPVAVDGLDAPVLRAGSEKEAGMRRGTADYGSRDGEAVTTDTKHFVFSIAKALSGSLLMMFVDQGVIRLDDPVGKILPEFDSEGVETPVTFHHLFTHTADMDGHFTDPWNDLEHVYGEAHPYLGIGKQHRYNGTSIAVGLKALEQLTGVTLPHLYQNYLFGPLGCESIESMDGSAMTWSNAHDLARVGQMLANHGAYGNLRFFSDETFQQMLPQKLDKLLGPDTKVTWGVGLTWFGGHGLSDRTIGHGSASSCTLRVDLENDLVITMTRATAGKNFKQYHPRFIKAITEGIEH